MKEIPTSLGQLSRGVPVSPENLNCVGAEINRLEKGLAVLRERVCELGGRLDPVLTPAVPSAPPGPGEARLTASPIAEHLRGIRGILTETQNDVENIISRINL